MQETAEPLSAEPLTVEDLPVPKPARRRRLLVKFSGAAMVGFTVSAIVLHLGLEAGLRPWIARLIALVCAMNVTFLINGKFVFKVLERRTFFAQWAAYTANSAVGNFCNYWTFVTLESTHREVIGNPYVALLVGSVVAWAINFMGARFVVFGEAGRRLAAKLKERFVSPHARRPVPESGEPGSSRR